MHGSNAVPIITLRLTCHGISTMVPSTAGETGLSSAEGATAPETLRQMDRSQVNNSGKRTGLMHGPTEGATSAQLGNLSGVEDRGGTDFAAGRS